jgi:hypothetical protein
MQTKNRNKHTPGPWKVFNAWNTADGVIGFSRIGNDEKNVIRSENTQVDIYATNEADLHLITAAPELLQACEAALNLAEEMSEGDLYDQIKNAIAKAKGEQ